MHNNTPQNAQEAVELGLYLAVTANTEQKSAEALELAKGLAQELNYAEVQEAKRNVAVRIERERQTRRDLSNVISAISPSETPFSREARERKSTRVGGGKAKYMPKPKRVTRAAIIDAIGCPHLVLERVKHRDALLGEHTAGFVFSYLGKNMYDDYEVLAQARGRPPAPQRPHARAVGREWPEPRRSGRAGGFKVMSDKLDPKMKPINGLAARVVFGEAVHYEPARKLTQAYTEIPPIETDQKRIASIAANPVGRKEFIEMFTQKHGRLKVIGLAKNHGEHGWEGKNGTHRNGVKLVCRCDCGHYVTVRRKTLKRGRLKNCGWCNQTDWLRQAPL